MVDIEKGMVDRRGSLRRKVFKSLKIARRYYANYYFKDNSAKVILLFLFVISLRQFERRTL